tara:strand:- start:68 stop:226 length:159 start_codon:yes stop_codon:yes gene_type:complete
MKERRPMTEERFNESLLAISNGNGSAEYKRKAKKNFFNRHYEEVYGKPRKRK